MKKVVKKRTNINRRKSVTKRAAMLMVFVLYLFSSILLKNYNTDLNHKLQGLQNDNISLKSENQTLRLKADDLKSFERMSTIAQKNGLQNREGTIKNVK